MNIKSHIVFFAFTLVLFACKKEELPTLPLENDPYYKVNGWVNDDSISWEVGVDNNILTYGVSHVNSVETYYGQITNGETGDAIRIEILRPEIYSDGTSLSAIKETELNFLVHEPGAMKINFGVNYNQLNYLLVKNSDGIFVPAAQISFEEYGVYDVTMKFTDYDDMLTFTTPVKYGFDHQLIDPGFNIYSQDDSACYMAKLSDGEHLWKIDGNEVSNKAIFWTTITDGIFVVEHEYKDEYGNKSIQKSLVRFEGNQFMWQMKFYYAPPALPSSNYGKVMVSMLKDGVWYYSEKTTSNLDYKFHVSNIATHLSFESNEKSKTAFDFKFTSVLYDSDHSDSLYLPHMTGRIGIEFE